MTLTNIDECEIEYPSEDGLLIAESDFTRHPMFYGIRSLDAYFSARQDAYVSGGLLMYYREGDPTARTAPDVFVEFGVDKHMRDHYLLWKEGKAPDFVLEITCESSRIADQHEKRMLYESLGVIEYFCFDPEREYLDPPLTGLRLEQGHYTPIAPTEQNSSKICIPSQTLGLDLCVENDEFRFFERRTTCVLESHLEIHQRVRSLETQIRELEGQLAVRNAKP